jgi:hypothetical protein
VSFREPDWSTSVDKWYIQTVSNEIKVCCTYQFHQLLVFETEEKAKLFLKEMEEEVKNL